MKCSNILDLEVGSYGQSFLNSLIRELTFRRDAVIFVHYLNSTFLVGWFYHNTISVSQRFYASFSSKEVLQKEYFLLSSWTTSDLILSITSFSVAHLGSFGIYELFFFKG